MRTTLQQPDGKTVIGGEFTAVGSTARNGLARLNADGSLDTGFNAAGTGAQGGAVNALALALQNAIVVGGEFTSVGGQPRNRIARVTSDGSLDPDFDPGSGANDTVNSVVVQPETNKVIVGGAFTSLADALRNALGRLNPSGKLDTSFDPGGGANAPVYTLAQRADGTVLAGGDFTQVATTSSIRLALVGTGEPAFFNGAVALSNGVFYLAFPNNGNIFGYYSLAYYPFLYHFDLGFEYVFDAQNSQNGVFLYDFASKSFFYTSPSFPFPYLYDFSLGVVLYYFPNPNDPQRYNTNGVRFFFNTATGQVISK